MNKKLIVAIAVCSAVFVFNNNIQAQDAAQPPMQGMAGQDQTPQQRLTMQVQRLTKTLSLNNDQVAKITPLLNERIQKREEMRTATDKRAAMKSMRDLVVAQDEKIKTILSADQYTKYTDLQDEAKDRMKGGRGGRRGDQ
jgi:hypothetical protein